MLLSPNAYPGPTTLNSLSFLSYSYIFFSKYTLLFCMSCSLVFISLKFSPSPDKSTFAFVNGDLCPTDCRVVGVF